MVQYILIIVNLDGSADFTNGTIDFTNANGKIVCSSTVTSMGTVDGLMGTVEYDGVTQGVHANTFIIFHCNYV